MMDIVDIIENHDLHIVEHHEFLRKQMKDDREEIYLKFYDTWEGCSMFCEDEHNHEPISQEEVASELYRHYNISKEALTVHEILTTTPDELERIRNT